MITAGTKITMSDTFDELKNVTSDDCDKISNDRSTARYEVYCGGRPILGSRMVKSEALCILAGVTSYADIIEKTCEISQKAVFAYSNKIHSNGRILTEMRGNKVALAINNDQLHENLLKHFSPKIEEWFASAISSGDATPEDFQKYVKFDNRVICSAVFYDESQYTIVLNASTRSIWSYKNGKPADITSAGFESAVHKLRFIASI